MVSHMIKSIKYLVIVVYDWIIQDSIIVLFCGNSRRGCTTSLMHQFSKATDTVLVPREALSFMNGQDMIYNGARVRYNCTDTPQDFIFCETCGMGTDWLRGPQPFLGSINGNTVGNQDTVLQPVLRLNCEIYIALLFKSLCLNNRSSHLIQV